jgi:hypothetical protein
MKIVKLFTVVSHPALSSLSMQSTDAEYCLRSAGNEQEQQEPQETSSKVLGLHVSLLRRSCECARTKGCLCCQVKMMGLQVFIMMGIRS